MLRPNEIVIDDGNHAAFLAPTVNGERVMTGLVPRDYGSHPVGCYAGERPMDAVTMPLIPRSEWSARINELAETKTQLSDFCLTGNGGQPIPSRDQNGRGYCATADTEILTTKGWVPYPEYDWTTPVGTVNRATHALEFQRPFERHVYEYDGPMIYSTNRRLDFGVTPDHQMYVRKWDERRRKLSPDYSFVRAADIGWYCGMMPAPRGQIGTEFVELEVPGDRRYDGDDFLALLGLVISDGYAGGTDGTKNWVSFASFREGTLGAVRALASRVGFRESPSKPGVFIRYDAGALAAWMRENGYAGGKTGALSKRVPDIVKVASVRQIKHFLHWFDDRNRDGSQFYSASKRLIDDLQELHLRIGKRGSIHASPAKDSRIGDKVIHGKGGYVLTVGQVDQLCIDRKKHIEQERYKGLVYCAAVPNHTLVTRRNGSVLISSNCWIHSGCSALIAARARDGQPYADLSAYAGACLIKNYRDEGGWGAQGLDWIMSRGLPTAEFWPQKSVSRANDNPATWENAKRYRFTEGWIDSGPQYDRALTFDQVATCLLCRIPVIGDFNWWGHSVCLLDLVEVEPGSFGVRIWNSWGDGWGTNGMGVLRGNKAVPDGATAPRVPTAA